jgi:outer membrane protein assembly factor BamB
VGRQKNHNLGSDCKVSAGVPKLSFGLRNRHLQLDHCHNLRAILYLVEILIIILILSHLSLWFITTEALAHETFVSTHLPGRAIKTSTGFPISSSQLFTYSTYLPVLNKPQFDVVSFPITGPAYAVPTLDDRYIYVGSGFDSDCRNTGQIRAFDKTTLALVWKTDISGAIGDTTLTLADNQVIFGVGDGLAALATSNGRLTWRLHLNGCFQESFIRLYQNRIYIGSSTGYIYSLTSQGQIVWQNRLSDMVFAAPAVAGDTLYFVDMSNTLTAVKLATGQIQWQKKLPLNSGARSGIFASPLFYDNSLFIATYSRDVWRVSLDGQIEAQYSSGDRYVANPIVCNGEIVVANLSSQIDWLSVADLHLYYTVITGEPLLFGTPQCAGQIVVVTSYGTAQEPSALYYLKNGQVLKRIEFPCCKHAITTTILDAKNVYNLLTTPDQADLIRSEFVVDEQ